MKQGNVMARWMYSGALGVIGGALVGALVAATIDAGRSTDTALLRFGIIVMVMLVAGMSGAIIGVLTRIAETREALKRSKPMNPP